MPKKARAGSSGRGRRTRSESEVAELRVREAAGRGALKYASASGQLSLVDLHRSTASSDLECLG